LGKIGKKLETVERKMIREKKNGNDHGKEEIKEENLGAREWTKEDNDKMGNMVDPYYKL